MHSLSLLFVFLLGASLNIFALGNSARLDRVDAVIPLSQMIAETLLYGLRGILLPALALYFLSYLPFIREPLLSISERCHALPKIILKGLVSFALLFPILVIAVLEWSLGAPGPGRAHNVSLFFVILLWPAILALFPMVKPNTLLTKPFRFSAMAIGLLILVMVNAKDLLLDRVNGKLVTYFNTIENARQQIQNSSLQNVVVYGEVDKPSHLNSVGHLVKFDHTNWVNQCVANYYQKESVAWRPTQ